MENKLRAYLGFSIKSNKAIFGLDKLEEYTKNNVHLVVVSSTVGDNTYKKVKALCEYRDWKMVRLKDGILLENIISRENCKILALLDKNLSNGVKDLDELFCQMEEV